LVEKFWYKVARVFSKTGGFPFPINDTLIELIQTIMTEEQAKFILNFRKTKMNIDQLKAKVNTDDHSLNKMLDGLMKDGIISGVPSRSTGIMVYTLMNLLPGIFEYAFMKGQYGEKEKKLANLFEKLFEELTESTQKNYESMVEQYKKFPPLERVVPVAEEVEVSEEQILPLEEVKKLVQNSESIGVAHCYCRHHKDLLGEHCKINAPKLNCMLLGKNATFAIEHEFAKVVSKERALEILSEAEDYGLVHKIFHANSDPNNSEVAICNCCKCCCETFQLYYRGIAPIHSLTSYVAKVDGDKCSSCGTCVERCPVEASKFIDTTAEIDETRCIGCGVCAHLCPEEAISLERIGPHRIFIPPKIIA